MFVPAENSEDQVEHEEGTQDDEGHVVHPREGTSERVIGLSKMRTPNYDTHL